MIGETLKAFQEHAGVTQAEMARAMCIPLRTYEDLIGGKSQIRAVHILAAEMALLSLANSKSEPNILTPNLQGLVTRLAELIAANKKPASKGG